MGNLHGIEEKILINTVGRLMGIQSQKLDVMLINAVRYSASQFVWHVMSHFPVMETYEMQEENFLTYDEFHQVFEKENRRPACCLVQRRDISLSALLRRIFWRPESVPRWSHRMR